MISGQPVAELDKLTQPYRLSLAGVHGAERLDINGKTDRVTLPESLQKGFCALLAIALDALPGCELESKGSGFALHYRQTPQQLHTVLALAKNKILCRAILLWPYSRGNMWWTSNFAE
ncbi:trehalose-phosphatase [Martelella alba]|uniref:trehalose-phosphatase n=1 Tax=Martelella alba TaxID=2590451 RepID=UPI0026C3F984|nr:trehalose-phosphatase [Martelella alba]